MKTLIKECELRPLPIILGFCEAFMLAKASKWTQALEKIDSLTLLPPPTSTDASPMHLMKERAQELH